MVFDNYIKIATDISGSDNSDPLALTKPKIQPNPFNTRATVSFSNPDNDPLSLRIIDINGKLIKEVNNIRESSVEIDRNNLPPGIHFIQLSGKSSSVAKILIE